MRVFELHRDQDATGVSGTGVVAEGIEFSDGQVAMRWRGERPSTVLHEDMSNVDAIHGHGGATRIVWCDER